MANITVASHAVTRDFVIRSVKRNMSGMVRVPATAEITRGVSQASTFPQNTRESENKKNNAFPVDRQRAIRIFSMLSISAHVRGKYWETSSR